MTNETTSTNSDSVVEADSVTLKPCPFCNGEEVGHQTKNGGMRHVCMTCGACGPDVSGSDEDGETWAAAGSAWNTRATEATHKERERALVEALTIGLAARDKALHEDANDQIGAFNTGALAFHAALAAQPRLPSDSVVEAAKLVESAVHYRCGDNCHEDRRGHEAGCAFNAWHNVLKPALAAQPRDNVREGGFLDTLRQVNGERAEAWAEGRPSDPLFWAIELGGEVGEILNVVKKLRREEIGWRGSRATLDDLSDEIADGLICLDSLARHYDIDLAEATACKFNKTSEKVGLPHRIDELLITQAPSPRG